MPQYNMQCLLPSSLSAVCMGMTVDLSENKSCTCPYLECSRHSQRSILYESIFKHVPKEPSIWFWCNALCSRFISVEVYLCCVNQHATTSPSPWMRNYVLVERYNKQNPADPLKWRKHVVRISRDYFLASLSSTNGFKSWPPLAGWTRTPFKAH